jgi:Tol biopolymer transport system component
MRLRGSGFSMLCCVVWAGCSFPDPIGDGPCTRCDLPARTTNAQLADAGADARSIAPPEAGPPPVKRCSPAAKFGDVKLVPGIDPNQHASSPHLTLDERVVFFTTLDPAGLASAQVFRATRATRDQPFGPAEPVPGLNSPQNDNDPTVSSDGLTLVFHSGRGGTNDVWWATRPNLTSEFGSPIPAPGIATGAYEGQGFFHVATEELWFVSDRDGSYDIFRAKRAEGVFGTAVSVAELNTAKDDFLPFLSEDGLTMFMSSTRDGGKGGQDLYLATRAAPTGTFGLPAPIDELNTNVTEQAGSLSPDACRIYFSRQGGAGGQQIFVAERPLTP